MPMPSSVCKSPVSLNVRQLGMRLEVIRHAPVLIGHRGVVRSVRVAVVEVIRVGLGAICASANGAANSFMKPVKSLDADQVQYNQPRRSLRSRT